ncbi:MAG: hypothetical protein ACR2IE_19360 [Candidatus Sumerlaeaceae bacterium]
MKEIVAASVILFTARSVSGQSVTVSSLDVENVSVFRGSGTVRASVNLETRSYSPGGTYSRGQLSALRSLGFFQIGNQWAYQAGNMKYALVVAQLPRLDYSRGQWKLVAPGKVTRRVATVRNTGVKR